LWLVVPPPVLSATPAAIWAEVVVPAAAAFAAAFATKRTVMLLVAILVAILFRTVPAAQRWRFGRAVHLVDSLLGQHGGDLIPL